MINIFNIIIILLLSFQEQKDSFYYNKEGRPSSKGIIEYVKRNEENIIKEYIYKIDTLYDVYMFTEDLSKGRIVDLGEFYIPDQIIITYKEVYSGYQFKDLPKNEKKYAFEEKTVNAVIFHELSHAYFYQTVQLSKDDTINPIFPVYYNFSIYPSTELKYGAEFIEEGVCEYIVYWMGESVLLKKPHTPKNEKNFLNVNLDYLIKYRYSVYFLKDFLEQYGIKKGIKILISNKPPTYEEILNPELFFKRLKYD